VRILTTFLRRQFKKNTTLWHEAGVVALWLYIAAVCSVTVNISGILNGYFRISSEYNLTPLAGIIQMAQSTSSGYAALNILGNIVMFMPLGFLLSLLWSKWRMPHIVIAALLCSVSIEVMQFFTGRGADIDDVILNTLGGITGTFVSWILQRIFPRAANAFLVSKGTHY